MNIILKEESLQRLHNGDVIPSTPDYYYEFLEILGEGAFCKVYRARYKPTNELIAVKVRKKIMLEYP